MTRGAWSDVLVVGGGAVGGAVALALAERGARVTVLESQRVGRGASWAAAGVLAPDRDPDDPPALIALARAGLKLWPAWAVEVEGRSGVGLNLRRDGLLHVWLDPEAPGLPPDVATRPPLDAGNHPMLDPAEVRRLEPALAGPVAGGWLDPDGAQVDNPRLAPALLRAAADLGARVEAGTAVAGLLGAGGRCHGVRTAAGVEHHAGAVVLAAGVWTGPLAAASGVSLPTVPWRGQMLALDAPTRPLRHVVFCGELVLVARPHGPVVVGTTFESVGYDDRVTLAGLHAVAARAGRVAPGLAALPVARTWAGLRPGTPDRLPYLGPVPGWDGLFAAAGHGRKGLVLAPVTAALLARRVLDGETDPLLAPCDPARAAVPNPATPPA